jgi:hypothetical protein
MTTSTPHAYPFSPSHVIASRSLRKADGVEVSVRICGPQPVADAPDEWFCAYRIDGLGAGSVDGYALGIDGVQALLLASLSIGDRLSLSPEPLTFLGGPDLRFPRSPASDADFSV